MKQRLIIADDHTLYRTGLKALVSEIEGVQVIAEAKDGRELFDLTLSLTPDILLMDYDMPGMSGLDLLYRLKQTRDAPQVKVVVITASTTEEVLSEFVSLGVDAILQKQDDTNEMIEGLNAVIRGDEYISDEILVRVKRAEAISNLTSRERQVIRLIAKGLSNKEISSVMGIAVKTVDGHRTSLMKKLGFHSAAEVVVFALKSGLG